jgi:hypothetical protein
MDFDITRFGAASITPANDFEPVEKPPGYLMRLIRQIEKPHYHPASMPSAGRLASPITKIVK